VRRVWSPRRPRTKCICLAVRVWLIFKQLPPLAAELLEQFKYIVITIITNTNGEQIRTPSVLIPHSQRSSKVLVIRFLDGQIPVQGPLPSLAVAVELGMFIQKVKGSYILSRSNIFHILYFFGSNLRYVFADFYN